MLGIVGALGDAFQQRRDATAAARSAPQEGAALPHDAVRVPLRCVPCSRARVLVVLGGNRRMC